MRHLLRHNGALGLLSILVVVGLLHGNLIGYSLQVPGRGSNTHLADTATPSPQQQDGKEHHVAIPLYATVPATPPEQLRIAAFDGATSSKGHLSDAYHAAASSARVYHAACVPWGSIPISRSHLFCVYRL